jgi:hypothetical protein
MNSRVPNLRKIAGLMDSLLGRQCSAIAGQPLEASEGLYAVVAIFIQEDRVVSHVVIADFLMANGAGGALTLLPAEQSQANARHGVVPENIFDNFSEVLNVLGSLFNVPGHPHVKMYGVYGPTDSIPPVVHQVVAKGQTRVDSQITIGGYGVGNLSIISVV